MFMIHILAFSKVKSSIFPMFKYLSKSSSSNVSLIHLLAGVLNSTAFNDFISSEVQVSGLTLLPLSNTFLMISKFSLHSVKVRDSLLHTSNNFVSTIASVVGLQKLYLWFF